MLKKIFCAAVFIATIYYAAIFLLINSASAQDVCIDTYSSRVQCYVMTETFVNNTQYRDNRAFSVKVKLVGATVAVNEYSFHENDGLVWFSVDGSKDALAENDEFAKRIWQFGLEYLGI